MFKLMLALTVVTSATSAFAIDYPSQCKLSIDSTVVAQGVGAVSARTNAGNEYTCTSTFNGSSIVSMTMTQGSTLLAKTQNIQSSLVSTVALEDGQPVAIECLCQMPETIGM